MHTLATRRRGIFRALATFVLALTLISLTSTDASAGIFGRGRAKRVGVGRAYYSRGYVGSYGPRYYSRGYVGSYGPRYYSRGYGGFYGTRGYNRGSSGLYNYISTVPNFTPPFMASPRYGYGSSFGSGLPY